MAKPLVYLIDDDVELSKLMAHRFKKFGCTYESFVDPASLFAAIAGARPVLILVDLNLGDGLSGYEIIKKIRGELKCEFPIVIMSGDKDQRKIAHGIEIGANDYIVKPPMRLDFEEIIARYLKAEFLAEPAPGEFHSVLASKRAAKFDFQIAIEEVHQDSLLLLSDHLIKKGAAFYLSGPSLKPIFTESERVFVRVIDTAAKVIDEQRRYQIRVEIDGAQEKALAEVRGFLGVHYAKK
jgi:CheY-like chemotaxis protein